MHPIHICSLLKYRIYGVTCNFLKRNINYFMETKNQQQPLNQNTHIHQHQMQSLLSLFTPENCQNARIYVSCIHQIIIDAIDNSQISIPSSSKPLPLRAVQIEQMDIAKCRQIEEEKRKIEEKLEQLKNQQKQLVKKNKQKSVSLAKSRTKSQFKEEEKQQIKKISKKLKQFQKILQKKTESVERNRTQSMRKEEQQKLEEQQRVNEKKKQIIKVRLQEIQNRDKEREKKKKQDAMLIKKIEAKRKLHQILQEQWKQKEEQCEKKRIQNMQKTIKSKYTNFPSLRQHQKQYDDAVAHRKMQHSQRKMQTSRLTNNSSAQFSISRFYNLVEEQEKKAKQAEKQKQEYKKMLRQKRSQYAELVKSQFAPKIKKNQKTETFEIKEQMKPKPSLEELRKMGDENLRAGNKKIKKKQESTGVGLDYKQNIQSMSGTNMKQDYLTQSRVFRESINPYSSPSKNPKGAAEKIIKNERLKQQQKVDQLKLLANNFDRKTNNIVEKIRGKLHMLQAIR